MIQQPRVIAVPLFCGICLLLHVLISPFLRLPFAFGTEDFFIADVLKASLPLQVAPLKTGEVWRTLSYALLHGSWIHLTLNLFGLWLTGGTLERQFGWRTTLRVLLMGCAAGAVGFVVSLLLDPRLSPATTCIGASALLTACIGTLTTAFPKHHVTLWVFVLPIRLRTLWLAPTMFLILAAESLFPLFGTAYGAHLGGWLAGLLAGSLLRSQTNP
ncbi:MAG: rhomboid family intramembrane serine protease [Kiritimatiellae bacterium]|nr:rhomboid family intramembrane serine protease [Kiritimatiellia bacterium]